MSNCLFFLRIRKKEIFVINVFVCLCSDYVYVMLVRGSRQTLLSVQFYFLPHFYTSIESTQTFISSNSCFQIYSLLFFKFHSSIVAIFQLLHVIFFLIWIESRQTFITGNLCLFFIILNLIVLHNSFFNSGDFSIAARNLFFPFFLSYISDIDWINSPPNSSSAAHELKATQPSLPEGSDTNSWHNASCWNQIFDSPEDILLNTL